MYTATVTGKNQITIPIAAVRALGIKAGDKLKVWVSDNELKAVTQTELLERLEGSVQVSKKLSHTPIEEAIQIGKDTYFKKKYGLR